MLFSKAKPVSYQFAPTKEAVACAASRKSSFLSHFSLRFRAAQNKPVTRAFTAGYIVTSVIKRAFLGAFTGCLSGTVVGAIGGAILGAGVGAGPGAVVGAVGGTVAGAAAGVLAGAMEGAAKLSMYKKQYNEHNLTFAKVDDMQRDIQKPANKVPKEDLCFA